GDDLHAQALRAAGDDRTDVARADEAQRLAGDFDAHEVILRPLTDLGATVCSRDLPGKRHDHRNRVFGSRDRVTERGVHHHHALAAGVRDIDVVDTDTGAANHLQVGGGVDDFLGDLGGRTDGEAIV